MPEALWYRERGWQEGTFAVHLKNVILSFKNVILSI
jgi:hypothetical protein